MWPISNAAAVAIYANERRKFPRRISGEEAELFIPVEDMRIPCVVANISAGGAKITCDAIPPIGTTVILFLKGRAGREAVTTRYGEGELGLRFTTPGDK
ncbi:MAG TPA: PilZ domain-containing protein [Rhizomicrobium sp.]|nr:PilZ domain-containing protein [Rhizomicrobium sp.]